MATYGATFINIVGICLYVTCLVILDIHLCGVSLGKYPHFCLCSLLYVNPVRSRFRHIHVVHGLSYPLAKLSPRLTVIVCGVVCNLLSHSLHSMTLGDNAAGFTLR